MTSQWISVMDGMWANGKAYIERAGEIYWVTLADTVETDVDTYKVKEYGPYKTFEDAQHLADRLIAPGQDPAFVRIAIKTALRSEPCSLKLLKGEYLKKYNIPNHMLMSELSRLIERTEIVPENGTDNDIWFFLAQGE
jgi:hypothetical protein